MSGPMGNTIIIAISSIQLGFLVSSLADGSSLMWLKGNPLKVMVGPQCLVKNDGTQAASPDAEDASRCHREQRTLREVLHYPYGMGVMTDMYGRGWNTHGETNSTNVNLRMTIAMLKTGQPPHDQPLNNEQIYNYVTRQIDERTAVHHFAEWLECDTLQQYGTALSLFVVMSVVLLILQYVVAALHQVKEHRAANLKMVSLILQSLVLVFLCVATGLGGRLFTKQFHCDNLYIPEITIRDSFMPGYAIYFIGFSMLLGIGSLIVAFVMLESVVTAEDSEQLGDGQVDQDNAGAPPADDAGKTGE